MFRKLAPLAAGALALTISATSVSAQTSVANLVTINVPEVLRLDITSTANFTLDPAAFDGGANSVVVDASTQPTVDVTANRNWQLSVAADAASWTYSGAHAAQSPNKAASDLQLGLTGASWTIGYTPAAKLALSTTSTQVATGGRGRTSGALVYSLTHNITDWPGSYELSVTYTLAGN